MQDGPTLDVRRRKILHLIPTLEGGGAERQLSYLGSELQRNGWDVTVAALRLGVNAERLARGEAKVITLRHSSTKDPFAMTELVSLMRRVRPDIVQTWLLYMDVVGGTAAMAARVPWIATERTEPSSLPLGLKNGLRRLLMLRAADAIVANSEDAVTYYRARGAKGHLAFVQNGVPMDELELLSPAERSELGIGRSAKLVVLAGRLSQEKDVDTFIRAVKPVRERVPDAEFAVFGMGPLRQSLERAAAELHVQRYVRFPGFVMDLPRWILAADVVVSSSTFEGSPNVVMEAMGLRRPLVLSDIASHRALAGDGAIYFPPRDAGELASCVAQALGDVAGTAARVALASARAQAFSVQAMATSYEEIYLAVCS